MTDLSNTEYRYWAFISYSKHDAQWARWLHRSIETYGIPAQFLSHTTPSGEPAPRRLRPIFRDREELPASADLAKQIFQALSASRFLIIICSPNAARSEWVNKEIELFRRLGRSDRVLAVIVDGEPHSGDARECFPPELTQLDPIAADARPEGDGKSDAKLKLLAGMLGVGLDALKQRDVVRRVRRARAIATASTALAIVLVGLTLFAFFQRGVAAAQRADALKQKGIAQDNAKLADTRRADAEDRGYGAGLGTAQLLLKNQDAAGALRALLATTPNLRSWEFDYLRAQVDSPTIHLEFGIPMAYAWFIGDGSRVVAVSEALSLERIVAALPASLLYSEQRALLTAPFNAGEEDYEVAVVLDSTTLTPLGAIIGLEARSASTLAAASRLLIRTTGSYELWDLQSIRRLGPIKGTPQLDEGCLSPHTLLSRSRSNFDIVHDNLTPEEQRSDAAVAAASLDSDRSSSLDLQSDPTDSSEAIQADQFWLTSLTDGTLVAECRIPPASAKSRSAVNASYFVACSRDGTRIVAWGETRSFVWSGQTGDLLSDLPFGEAHGTMSSDLAYLLGMRPWDDHVLRILPVERPFEGRSVGLDAAVIRGPMPVRGQPGVAWVECDDGDIVLIDIRNGVPISTLRDVSNPPQELRASPDGSMVASGLGSDGPACVWNVETGELLVSATQGAGYSSPALEFIESEGAVGLTLHNGHLWVLSGDPIRRTHMMPGLLRGGVTSWDEPAGCVTVTRSPWATDGPTTAAVWDLNTETVRALLVGFPAFDSSGKIAVTVDSEGVLRRYDLLAQRAHRTVPLDVRVMAPGAGLYYDEASGALLATSATGGGAFQRLTAGLFETPKEITALWGESLVPRGSWAPALGMPRVLGDGRTVVGMWESELLVWVAGEEEAKYRIPMPAPYGSGDAWLGCSTVELSTAGPLAVAWGRVDADPASWVLAVDTQTGLCRASRITAPICCMLPKRGVALESRPPEGGLVWVDLESGESLGLLTSSMDETWKYFASPDQGAIVAVSDRGGIGVIEAGMIPDAQVYEVQTHGQSPGRMPTSAAFSQQFCALSCLGEVTVVDLLERRVLFRVETAPATSCAILSRDGRRLLAPLAGPRLGVWDTRRGELLIALDLELTGAVEDIALTPDGHRLAILCSDGSIHFMDAQ